MCALSHTRAEVDEIRRVFHDDRRRWPGTIRIDRRVARAEHHDERPVRAHGLQALSHQRHAEDCCTEQEYETLPYQMPRYSVPPRRDLKE